MWSLYLMNKVQQPAKLEPAAQQSANESQLEPSRRQFLAGLAGTAVVSALPGYKAVAQAAERAVNVARVAVPSSLTLASENNISALNDGFEPENSFDRTYGIYSVWEDDSGKGQHP